MGKTSAIKSIQLREEALSILSFYLNPDLPATRYIFPLLDNEAPSAKAITQEEKNQLPAKRSKNLAQQVNSKNSLINTLRKLQI